MDRRASKAWAVVQISLEGEKCGLSDESSCWWELWEFLHKEIAAIRSPICCKPPIVPQDEMGLLLSEVLETQNELGWDNFAKERISKFWGKAQKVHLNIFHPGSKKYTVEGWEKVAVKAMWNAFYHTWVSYNRALHDAAHNPSDPSILNDQIKY
eukprot:9301364-Ditylum_brightwellii.AAC.1